MSSTRSACHSGLHSTSRGSWCSPLATSSQSSRTTDHSKICSPSTAAASYHDLFSTISSDFIHKSTNFDSRSLSRDLEPRRSLSPCSCPARAISAAHLLVVAARSRTRSPSFEHTVLDSCGSAGLHSGFGPRSAVGRLPLGICVRRDSTWLLDSWPSAETERRQRLTQRLQLTSVKLP